MLGKRLREIRMAHALTQQQTADHLMISLNAYQKYEQGTRAPSPETLVNLADFFDTSTDWILGRTEDPSFSRDVGER